MRRCAIPTYKRLPRGKEKRHDEFIDWSMHVMIWVKEHWAGVLELVAFAGIAVAVVIGASAYGKSRAEKAAMALYQAQKLASGSEERATALKGVVEDFPRSFAGKSALMEIGEGQIAKGDSAAAIESLRTLADRSRSQPLFRIAALHRMASAQAAKGEWLLAAETFRKAAADPGNVLALTSELLAGICLERAGDAAAAVQLYQRIIKDAGENDRAVRDASEERLLWLTATGHTAG